MNECTKKCGKCKKVKECSDFHKRRKEKDGLYYACKLCTNSHEKYRYYSKVGKNQRLKRTYSLTEEELIKIHESQNKRCKICKKYSEKLSESGGLYIDHCHKSRKVRGLLCSRCNRLLGNVDDNIDILKSAILYLKNN